MNRATPPGSWSFFERDSASGVTVLRLRSLDGINQLNGACVAALLHEIGILREEWPARPLVFAGNEKYFSAGADLREIRALAAPAAYEFALLGQRLMNSIAHFPAATCAAIEGFCMGGGLDLALSCRFRVASPNAIFGHRGASLGLLTGWGGTQRLPRLIGKGRALQMVCAAEKLTAEQALEIGLIDQISGDALSVAVRRVAQLKP